MKTIGTGTFKATPYMRQLVESILNGGRVSYGPLSLALEKKFSSIHGAKYGILSNSGTSSLQVALRAMMEVHGWERGGRVIVPATTFVATPNIVTHNGMVPTFVDVDPRTYNLDPTLLERVITNDTKAIIPVHLFGQPANMTAIKEIADRHGLKIIEDSCETMFAKHAGKTVGTWGDIACFSFYVAHLVVAGVGGMGITNNPDYAAKMRSLVNHGMDLNELNPGENFSPQPTMARRFLFSTTGYSYRITEFEAALALAQLTNWEQIIALRGRNARHLSQGLHNINENFGDTFQLPFTLTENEHAFMMFPIVLKKGNKRSLVQHLAKHGIETRDMLPLLNQPAFSYLNPEAFPVSLNLIENGIYVGCHQDLDTNDIAYMVDVFGIWVDPAYQGTHL